MLFNKADMYFVWRVLTCIDKWPLDLSTSYYKNDLIFGCTTYGYNAAFQLLREIYFFRDKNLIRILNGYFLYCDTARYRIAIAVVLLYLGIFLFLFDQLSTCCFRESELCFRSFHVMCSKVDLYKALINLRKQ